MYTVKISCLDGLLSLPVGSQITQDIPINCSNQMSHISIYLFIFGHIPSQRQSISKLTFYLPTKTKLDKNSRQDKPPESNQTV